MVAFPAGHPCPVLPSAMSESVRQQLSRKYCPRFGQLAVESRFISEAQLAAALAEQVHEELHGVGHRLLGEILFDRNLLSAAQIDQVMTRLFKELRRAESAGA